MKFNVSIFFMFFLFVSKTFSLGVELLVSQQIANSFRYKLDIERIQSGKTSITEGRKKIRNQDATLSVGSDQIYGNKKYYTVFYDISYAIKNRWGKGDKLTKVHFLGGYRDGFVRVKGTDLPKKSHCISFALIGKELKEKNKVLIITVDEVSGKVVFALNWSKKRSSLEQLPFFNDSINFISTEKESIISDQVSDFIQQTVCFKDDFRKTFTLDCT